MFDDRLKQLRLEKNISMRQVSIALGMPYTTYVGYEKNEREPNSEALVLIANYFNVSVDYLIGRSDNRNLPAESNEPANNTNIVDLYSIKNIEPLPKMKKVPLLGTIACGEPITAEENIEDYVNMPENTNGTFALRCKGDSMINARINDGDIVYIKEQPTVENGQIAAVLIDGEATLKRVYYYPEKQTLILKAENTKYDDFIYTGTELEAVKIIGKAVGFYSFLG